MLGGGGGVVTTLLGVVNIAQSKIAAMTGLYGGKNFQ